MRVSELRSRSDVLSLEGEWNALVGAARGGANARHEFFRVFMDSFFGAWDGIRVLLARDGAGRLRGVLPLVSSSGSFYGLPVRRLGAAINHYFTRFDLLTDAPGEVPGAFLSHLEEDRRWDVLTLSYVPADGHLWRLYAASPRAVRHETLRSPYLSLPGSMDALYKGLKPKFRANLRRRRQKLEAAGPVEVERFTGGPGLERRLEEGLAVEGSGWKGKEGTAIAVDPAAGRFYRALAEEASRAGYLALYFLKSGGRTVGFQFGLNDGDRYLLLKTGYDESFKEFSPGHLLVEEVLKDCVASGLREFDFLAESMPWKEDWTAQSRPHSVMHLFPGTLYGRFLWQMKARGVPWAKRLSGLLSGLRSKPLAPTS